MPSRTLFMLVFSTVAQTQQEVQYALLPARAANGVVAHRGTWTPTKADIAEIEAKTPQRGRHATAGVKRDVPPSDDTEALPRGCLNLE
jgi:hypothetical protein